MGAYASPNQEQHLRRVRQLADYGGTPEWVLHRLMQHAAEHRSEIGA